MAKAGYTKTGKSIKAVKRYYALLNAQKKPDRDDEDKLSKRIAAELQVQKTANEKRGVFLSELPTERSGLPPVMMSPKEAGPVFIAAPKSTKSIKSAGQGTIGQFADNKETFQEDEELSTFQKHCLVICLFLVVNFVIAWISEIIFYQLKDPPRPKTKYIPPEHYTYHVTYMLGIVSVIVGATIVYWYMMRSRLYHNVPCFIAILLSLITMAYTMYYYISSRSDARSNFYYAEFNDHIIAYLILSFVILQLLILYFITRQYVQLSRKGTDLAIKSTTQPNQGAMSTALGV